MSTQSLENIGNETRETLEKQAQAKIDLIEARLEEVKAKANTAKAEYLETEKELEQQRQKAAQYFENLQQAGDDAWKEIHASFESAVGELQSGVDKAIAYLQSAAK
ncbi:MAG: hypothetical protein ACFB9N_12795 [Geitlerinemataceae cyanobacterium]